MLGEYADAGLGAAEADDDPRAVEADLAAVRIADPLDGQIEGGQLAVFKHPTVDLVPALRGQGPVALGHVQLAEGVEDVPDQPGQRLPGDAQHLHQQRRGVEAVLAEDVPPHRQAAGGFAADEGVAGLHARGDVLEAHGHLHALFAELRGHPIQQVGGGHIAHRRAPPALVFQQIVVQQHQYLVGADVAAPLVDHAQPVRVAVGGDADVGVVLQHRLLEVGQGLRVRRGQVASEEGVVPVVDDVHVAAAGIEDGQKPRQAHAVHRVQHDARAASADGLGVDLLHDGVQVGVAGVDIDDAALGQALPEGNGPDLLLRQCVGLGLDFVGDCLRRVSAAAGEQLDAVVHGGVVAGGDGRAIGKVPGFYRVHDLRRRRGEVHEVHLDALRGDGLGKPYRGFPGEEAPVVANAELPRRFPPHPAPQRRGDPLDVDPGEAVADDGPPAAGAKLYHRLPPHPITTRTACLPPSNTGTQAAGAPSTSMRRTPFSTCSGFSTTMS